MNDIRLSVTRILVLFTDSTDRVYIHTQLPSPFPPGLSSDDLVVTFETTTGKGVQYVKDHFGIDPEVLDTTGRRVGPA